MLYSALFLSPRLRVPVSFFRVCVFLLSECHLELRARALLRRNLHRGADLAGEHLHQAQAQRPALPPVNARRQP